MTSDSGLNTAARHIARAVDPSNRKSSSLRTVSERSLAVRHHVRAALADTRSHIRGEFQQSSKI